MSPSWLLLERYALGECTADEVRAIELALRTDPDGQAILAAIREDRRALPPLPRRRNPWPVIGVALLAAAALLVVGLPDRDRVKGGTLALELVRVVDGVATPVTEAAVGERLGVRLTCPPGPTRAEVVVFHGGEAAFPFAPATVACGNGVPIPGAFSVDAPGPLTVCVALGRPRPADRGAADVCVEVPVR